MFPPSALILITENIKKGCRGNIATLSFIHSISCSTISVIAPVLLHSNSCQPPVHPRTPSTAFLTTRAVMCAPTSEDYHKLTSNGQTKTFTIFTLSQTLIIYRGNRVCGCVGGRQKKNELLTFSEQHLLYLVTTALQRAPFTRWRRGGELLAVCVACRAWIAIGSL